MNKLTRTIGWTAACGATALLMACGGGGGSGSGAMGDINGSGAKVFKRGAVTGFGSVIVEGERFETGRAMVEIDGIAAAEGNLRVGQIVEVDGIRDPDDGSLVADRIRYDAELRGPVGMIDRDNDSFEVAGQLVRINGATIFDDTDFASLADGDRVEVSGEITGEGEFLASYVEAEDDGGTEVEVTGRVDNLDGAAESFRLRSLTIDFSGATVEDGPLANGALVEAVGSLSGSTLTASDIEVEDRPGAPDDDDRIEAGTEIEITGPVGALDMAAGTFRVRRYVVRYDDSTEIDDGGTLANGRFVEVEGIVNDAGEILAEEIELEDRRDPGNRAGRFELEGAIDLLDSDARSLTVEGILIETDQRTRFNDVRFEELRVGERVELSAVRLGRDDRVVALRIEREADDDGSDDGDDGERDDQELAGPVENLDEAMSQITVLGVTVDVSGADFEGEDGDLTSEEFFASTQVGDFVEVKGRFESDQGERFIAGSVEREAEEDDADDADDDGEEVPESAGPPGDGIPEEGEDNAPVN